MQEPVVTETTNKWGLSNKTNIGLAAITVIGYISTSAAGELYVRILGIACVTGLAVYGIGRQFIIDKEKVKK
jgi:hypothetical protein